MEGFVSRTGSSRGVIKQNGEIIARPHPVMPKSYAGSHAKSGLNRCAQRRGKGGESRCARPGGAIEPSAARPACAAR